MPNGSHHRRGNTGKSSRGKSKRSGETRVDKVRGRKHNRKNLALAKHLGLHTSEFGDSASVGQIVSASDHRFEPPLRANPGTSYRHLPSYVRELLGLRELKQKFDRMENEYYDLEDGRGESAGDVQRFQDARRDFQSLWEAQFDVDFPHTMEEALDSWSEHMNTLHAAKLRQLSRLTDLPPPLTRDTVNIPMGEKLEHFESLLERLGFEMNETGVSQYIRSQLENFSEIRRQLLSEPEVIGELWEGDVSRMTIEFTPFSADEHGFAPPTKLDVSDGVSEKSLVMKSRVGEIDKRVTDLFARINAVERDSGQLPVYQQALFRNKFLLSEFIAGKEVVGPLRFDPEAANGHVVTITKKDGPDDRPSAEAFSAPLQKNVLWLQQVARAIGLTDLHSENIVLDIVRQRVVPIDLEAFTVGEPQETGLFGQADYPEPQALPEPVQRLVDTFNRERDAIERRFVPVPTGQLVNTLKHDGVDATSELIQGSLEHNGLTVDKEALKRYVTAARDHQPPLVPSFTLRGGTLFTSSVGGRKTEVASL